MVYLRSMPETKEPEGCDHYTALKGQSRAEFEKHLAAVTAYAASLPPEKFYGREMTISVEMLVAKAMDRALDQRRLRRTLAKSTVFLSPQGELLQMRGAFTAAMEAEIQRRHPGATILNKLPEEAALDLFIERTQPKR